MSLVIEVKAFPNSGHQRIILGPNNSLKIYVKSSPKQGKANTELTKLLAKKSGLPPSDITIIAGATTRKKLVKLTTDIPFERLLDALGIHQQTTLFKSIQLP